MELLIEYLARFGHLLAGVVWIGMLYYFNFVQTEYFKEAEGDARVDAFSKLVPRALWWFRWAAMLTFLSGVILLGYKHSGLTPDITLGATMGILMFLNVWLIIWPNQRIVIASNQAVAAGGDANPAAAAAAPKAALASRTNVLFSIPMLYFMGSSAHFAINGSIGANATSLGVVLAIIAAIEVNAIVGKQGVLTSIRGVITSGFVLTVLMAGILYVL